MLSFDLLVIGSGIGGLGFALKVAGKAKVAVICKSNAFATNTNLAQGGISAVFSPEDSVAQHIADTISAGAGLCNPETVRFFAQKAPGCIRELQALGVNFTRTPQGDLDLGREGGHLQNRIVHTHDHTGSSIQQALLQKARSHPNITLLEDHFAIDLLLTEETSGKNKCIGVSTFSAEKATTFPVYGKAVMLASGGAGQVFQHTTNPAVATGDGIAMAYRAGAAVKHMEFFQFHPTALYDPGKPTFLISEAVRGFGAELVNAKGLPFMHLYHQMGSLAPRDIVARAIQEELQKTGAPCVYLDLRKLPAAEIKIRFPKIFARCLESDLDLAADLIPVVPAAHYLCGGIVTDTYGQTTLEGLYSCGETACTGLHGANRLASNSLPEAWLFADRAAEHALLHHLQDLPPAIKPWSAQPGQTLTAPPAGIINRRKTNIRNLMWQHAGIVRTTQGLLNCRQKLEEMHHETQTLLPQFPASVALLELRNLVQVALLIVEAALNRSESVGCHYITSTFSPGKNQSKSGFAVLK